MSIEVVIFCGGKILIVHIHGALCITLLHQIYQTTLYPSTILKHMKDSSLHEGKSLSQKYYKIQMIGQSLEQIQIVQEYYLVWFRKNRNIIGCFET